MRRGESGLNCLIGIDKPQGLTSHDVVSRVRRAVGERRVGHAGTLDPLATGALVVGVGQATRLLGLLTLDVKSYGALISFGRETETDDAEGATRREAPVPDDLADEAFAAAAVAGLVGEVDQVPPAYSAISVGGRRSYDRARAGEQVDLPARHVTILEAGLLGIGRDTDGALAWRVALRVSKGTYIRSIARDLGRSLGTAAHVAELRRTSSGPVGLSACVGLDQLEEGGRACLLERQLDPTVALGLPVRPLVAGELDDVRCGRALGLGGLALAEGDRCSLVADGLLMGVWHRQGRWLRSDATFPAGITGVRP